MFSASSVPTPAYLLCAAGALGVADAPVGTSVPRGREEPGEELAEPGDFNTATVASVVELVLTHYRDCRHRERHGSKVPSLGLVSGIVFVLVLSAEL